MKISIFIRKYKTYILLIILFILSTLGVVLKSIDYKKRVVNSTDSSNIKNNEIVVYIIGEVKSPGVYKLQESSRLQDLLNICGGITENADINKINLAQRLKDGDKITILEKNNTIDSDLDEKSDDKVNINNASKNELTKLDGIGESTAQKIIDYRNTNSFDDIEDIMNVPGIGNSKFEAIKDRISVN